MKYAMIAMIAICATLLSPSTQAQEPAECAITSAIVNAAQEAGWMVVEYDKADEVAKIVTTLLELSPPPEGHPTDFTKVDFVAFAFSPKAAGPQVVNIALSTKGCIVDVVQGYTPQRFYELLEKALGRAA